MVTFSASIRGFNERSMGRVLAVCRASSQEVAKIAQTPKAQGGRMPADKGVLRNSFVSWLNGSTSLTGVEAYVLTIAEMRLGDTVSMGWTADHALAREFGARGIAPDFYARGAAQEWQNIVGGVVDRL